MIIHNETLIMFIVVYTHLLLNVGLFRLVDTTVCQELRPHGSRHSSVGTRLEPHTSGCLLGL